MRVIGMISGTSFDAVEAVLADFVPRADVLECELVARRSVPYPEDLRDKIAAVLPPAVTDAGAICELDAGIGQFFAEVAHDLASEAGAGRVQLVCSHGQTVFHWVSGDRALGTLQLGQPAWIAERTGATVVSDVRSRDIAAGGHGAPLASVLDVLLLAPGAGTVRGALNLGGIANVTVLGSGRDPVAFDIGPANALMDAVVTSLSGGQERFDENGRRAGAGPCRRRPLGDVARRALLLAPRPEVDGQGAVQPRLRRERPRRPGARRRRPRGNPDRAHRRDRGEGPHRIPRHRSGRRWRGHPQSCADVGPARASRGRGLPSSGGLRGPRGLQGSPRLRSDRLPDRLRAQGVGAVVHRGAPCESARVHHSRSRAATGRGRARASFPSRRARGRGDGGAR